MYIIFLFSVFPNPLRTDNEKSVKLYTSRLIEKDKKDKKRLPRNSKTL